MAYAHDSNTEADASTQTGWRLSPEIIAAMRAVAPVKDSRKVLNGAHVWRSADGRQVVEATDGRKLIRVIGTRADSARVASDSAPCIVPLDLLAKARGIAGKEDSVITAGEHSISLRDDAATGCASAPAIDGSFPNVDAILPTMREGWGLVPGLVKGAPVPSDDTPDEKLWVATLTLGAANLRAMADALHRLELPREGAVTFLIPADRSRVVPIVTTTAKGESVVGLIMPIREGDDGGPAILNVLQDVGILPAADAEAPKAKRKARKPKVQPAQPQPTPETATPTGEDSATAKQPEGAGEDQPRAPYAVADEAFARKLVSAGEPWACTPEQWLDRCRWIHGVQPPKVELPSGETLVLAPRSTEQDWRKRKRNTNAIESLRAGQVRMAVDLGIIPAPAPAEATGEVSESAGAPSAEATGEVIRGEELKRGERVFYKAGRGQAFPCIGRKITIPGWEDQDFYTNKTDQGFWEVTHGASGRRISGGRNKTIKQAATTTEVLLSRPDARAILAAASEGFAELISNVKQATEQARAYEEWLRAASDRELIEASASRPNGGNVCLRQEIACRYNALSHEEKLRTPAAEWKRRILAGEDQAEQPQAEPQAADSPKGAGEDSGGLVHDHRALVASMDREQQAESLPTQDADLENPYTWSEELFIYTRLTELANRPSNSRDRQESKFLGERLKRLARFGPRYREAWQVPLADFLAVDPPTKWSESADPDWARDWRGNRKITHRNQVRMALEFGLKAPAEVLADYPELAPIPAVAA